MNVKKPYRCLSSCAFAVLALIALLVAVPARAYAASRYASVEARVPVTVSLAGDAAAATPDFTFKMTPVDGEEVSPASDELAVNGAGSVFFSLAFDEVGEHHYSVTQVSGTADGWTYDVQTYDVTVFCMWDEATDALFTKVIVRDAQGFKASSCEFSNTYEAPAAPSELGRGGNGSLAGTGDASSNDWRPLLACGVVVVAVAGAAAFRRHRG